MMDEADFKRSIHVIFFLRGEARSLTARRLFQVPRRGDFCVFNGIRYLVDGIEWCLDKEATALGTRVNVELMQLSAHHGETLEPTA